MKSYTRQTPEFSLCGLNCCLCPRYRTDGVSRCPGCGGEDFYVKHPTCAIITCSMKHDGVSYCFQCKDYPCGRYHRTNDKDSFITYLHVPSDMDAARRDGLEFYLKDLSRKSEILDTLLEKWDNGRLKSFFCLAVNLLPLSDLQTAMATLESVKNQMEPDAVTNSIPAHTNPGNLAKDTFHQLAAARGIELELRR